MADSVTLSDDLDENYDRFLAEAEEMGCVWALEGDEGFALCPSNISETVDVIPMWSQPEFANAHATEEWADYKVVPIALEELLDEWLPGMHDDLLLVGVNWGTSMDGDEVEPLDLLEEFEG